MLSPRWRKVWRDLWSNKTRTLLVLLSIAVGVTAIGMVMGAQTIVDENLPAAYAAVNPASGQTFTLTTFDDNMVESIRRMDEGCFRHMPVTEGSRIVGVVSWRDLPFDDRAEMEPELETRHKLAERMW